MPANRKRLTDFGMASSSSESSNCWCVNLMTLTISLFVCFPQKLDYFDRTEWKEMVLILFKHKMQNSQLNLYDQFGGLCADLAPHKQAWVVWIFSICIDHSSFHCISSDKFSDMWHLISRWNQDLGCSFDVCNVTTLPVWLLPAVENLMLSS